MASSDPQIAVVADTAGETWFQRSLFDGWLLQQLKDPRDLSGARMMLRMALATTLGAILLFIPGVKSSWSVGLYLMLVFSTMASFILGMHAHYHRLWFKSRFLNKLMPSYIGFFYGMSFGTYWAHHLAMHHPEDNGDADLSSTQPYQRDHAGHLGLYLLIYLIIGIPQLIVYFFKKGRPEIAWKVILGEAATWAILGSLALYDWQATLLVFIVPLCVARFMMMLGNWGQHAFVRPQGDNKYTSGTTLLRTGHNRRCFNNGYHALHHARQALHWSLMPAEFEKERAEYAKAGAAVFEGVPTFQVITMALILRRYAWLETRLVRFEGDERSAAERITWMRGRTRPLLATAAVSTAQA